MTQDRIDLLDELGFPWEVRPSLERPRTTYRYLATTTGGTPSDYKQKNGDFKVEPTAMPQVHGWCHEQRQRLKFLEKNNGKDVSKRMNPERVEALESIGFSKDTELHDIVKTLLYSSPKEISSTLFVRVLLTTKLWRHLWVPLTIL